MILCCVIDFDKGMPILLINALPTWIIVVRFCLELTICVFDNLSLLKIDPLMNLTGIIRFSCNNNFHIDLDRRILKLANNHVGLFVLCTVQVAQCLDYF
jgi:hypothetical protein